jgi:ABC-2 type transport system ATP-binding protein
LVVLPELAVLFDNVTKRFAGQTAVQDLSFCVPRGAVYGLLGPNGAGKTTSIRILMAILHPDAGRVRVFGTEPTDSLKERIGYLPEERGLYGGMKVIDNLAFFGAIRGLSPGAARHLADGWLERFSMAADRNRRLQELSKGNQQKIQFIATAIHRPDLLVLDEPFAGLDPVNQDLMRRTILELVHDGATVILSTHRMDEVERLCSHLTLIHRGRALVDGELKDVKRQHGSDTIRLELEGDASPVDTHPAVAHAGGVGNTREIRLRAGHDPSEFLASIAGRTRIRRFEVRAPSLHSIFVHLVEGHSDPTAGTAEIAVAGEVAS